MGRKNIDQINSIKDNMIYDDVQKIGQAQVNILKAENSLETLSLSDLQAKAATYVPVNAAATDTDIAESIAASPAQAEALVASGLTAPAIDDVNTPEDLKNIIKKLGVLAEKEVIEQAAITADAARVSTLTISGKTVDKYYKNGIQWWSQGGGTKTQGEPFEIWMNQTLKPQGYFWLADYKSNWKTFDHWNAGTGSAVSDKTLDLNAASYKFRNSILEGRIVRYFDKMFQYKYDIGAAKISTSDPDLL